MKRFKFVVLLIIQGLFMMNTSVYAGSERGDFHTLYQGESVDDLIIQYMADNHIPGMSLAIVQAPYITRVVSYGLANTENKRLVGVNTVFNIGQITNAYTAVAVMQLKEAGKLDLDKPIATYLSNQPANWQNITIKQLMSHRSGIPDYTKSPQFDASKNYTPETLLALVKDAPLLFKPGTKGSFSGTDNYLLGLIIEKTSGMTYQAFVTKYQIEAVGLTHTFFVGNENAIVNEVGQDPTPLKHSQFLQNPKMISPTEPAVGYQEEGGTMTRAKPVTWSATFSNSGIIASAQDISLWDIALAGTILVKDPTNREFLYHPSTLDNGELSKGNVGWIFPGHLGLLEIRGNMLGYSSFLSRFTAPTELVCVTLLANKGNLPDLDILARKIAGAFDEKLASPAGAPWSETLQSPYSVTETMDRVAALVRQQGGRVFARIDQSGEAKKAGQDLLDTQVLILGNPAKGTALIQTKPALSLDLPLRVMATEGKDKQVWLSFTDPEKLAKAYHVSANELPVLKQMGAAMKKLCEEAVSSNAVPDQSSSEEER